MRYIREYGLEGELGRSPDGVLTDETHPYIHVDMNRCVYCYRCVRICEEVGQFAWKAVNRGDETRILPDSGTSLLESSCVSCGACVDTCPSGALTDQALFRFGAAESWTRTTCPYCGVGCEMEAGTRQGRIVASRPVLDAPVNRGHLCVKGRYAYRYVHAGDRITVPMAREKGGEWREVTWDEALAIAADGLQKALAEKGPSGVGVLGSARGTNEECYLAQKFARVVLGSNSVDACHRVCHSPTAVGMMKTLGTGAATNSFRDVELARTLLVAGSNATENHPIVGARVKQAALKGANLIVIDPRATELAAMADFHLQLKPGTNVALFNSMACAIVEEGLFDGEFVANRLEEWDEFREFIGEFTPEKMESVTGVPAKQVREAARLYAMAKPSMSIHGLGMTEHTQGTEGVMTLVTLALITGNIGVRGAGVNPLRGQNNVQGSGHMGCKPDALPGGVPLAKGRAGFEAVWGAPVPEHEGANLMQMMDLAEEGALKALWVIGYDILFTNANAHTTRKALSSVDTLIVQDLFMTETAREAGTLFLPATASHEKEGTFMNGERRIQRVRKVVDPPGQARADWEIICDVAARMGSGERFSYSSAEDIFEEIRAVWPGGAGMSYKRFEQEGGLQWPCPDDGPPTEVLHTESFPHGVKTALKRIPYIPTEEKADQSYPFVLVSGRTLYQFNARTMTGRTDNVKLLETDYVDICPADAMGLGVADGDRVRMKSRYGEATLPVRVTAAVRKGELFATFHDPKVFLNNLTGPRRDRLVQTPEYKVTAVALEKD